MIENKDKWDLIRLGSNVLIMAISGILGLYFLWIGKLELAICCSFVYSSSCAGYNHLNMKIQKTICDLENNIKELKNDSK